ncbi:hypothetical protein CF327_g5740 [Tilletia walkeri]|uniref:NAD(P)-binding domain-containing protein n=1 Tax=Tilletia walkeri TaxID=117179 RepID=A0A8X7T3S4_9BASI|nr:hypothetical protein CF327_g5740 [Tilletia walkeri]KAE8267701.1 hypothetical protein A4X09_0g4649 [Tilletia walkeri]
MTVAAVVPGADTILGHATIEGLVQFPGMAVRSLTPQPGLPLRDPSFAEKNVMTVLCVASKRDTVGASIAGADIVVAVLDEAQAEAADEPQLEMMIDEAIRKHVKLFIWFQPALRDAYGEGTARILAKLRASSLCWVGLSTGFLMESLIDDQVVLETVDSFHIDVPVLRPETQVFWTHAKTDIKWIIQRIVRFWETGGAPAKLFQELHVVAAQRASLAQLAALIEKRVDKPVRVVTRPQARTPSITHALETMNDSKLSAEEESVPSETMKEIGVSFMPLDQFAEHELIPTLSHKAAKYRLAPL